ncbi:hypothetical protein IMW64_01300 [Ehrlichia ruminantium]|nr:hypothetical protein FDZ59_01295 [Ehrlichia ruminantium]UOD98114.1 hypothetical protein IMW64_01300 [Ehrlichia ruminantium]
MGYLGFLLLCYIAIIFFLLAVVMIFYSMFRILWKRDSQSLLQTKLSQIVSSADTTMKNGKCSYKGRISFYVNGMDVVTLLTDRFYYYRGKQSDKLVMKHLKYVQNTMSYNGCSKSDRTIRAIMGAALESILIQNVKEKPNMCLIHHTISYLYAQGYDNLLLNIIDNVVSQKEYMNETTLYSLPRYYSSKTLTSVTIKMFPNQLYVNMTLNDPIINETALGMEHSNTFSSMMELFILPKKRSSRVLQYSGEFVSLIAQDSCSMKVHTVQYSIPTFFVKECIPTVEQVQYSIPLLDNVTANTATLTA